MVVPRRESILHFPLDSRKSDIKKRIAVITSGGDAPGMNAAVRSVVRIALVKGCEAYAALEGYQGLVDGGDKIKRMYWDDVQGILAQGGTIIGTARCKEFRERSGRLKAVKNLVEKGIDCLVVIGGDGSLTGADFLRSEWKDLLLELVEKKEITPEQAARHEHLAIVGMVGSIDNDMAMTDLTIGAISSLHRICEAVDCISSTAVSHQRAFVIEVMGRHCGWLALYSAIATGADWLFIPENPPKDDWAEKMCNHLKDFKAMGKRKCIIIVAEGAIDRNLKPIKAEEIKELLTSKLNFDTRVTTLGHVQRGGSSAALDRIVGTLQGLEAVEALLRATNDSEAPLIGIKENKITVVPLMEAVKQTKAISQAISEKRFDDVMKLRHPEYSNAFDAFMATCGYEKVSHKEVSKKLRVAIVHTGAPAGGMNMATRAVVRTAINRGHQPLVIHNGFRGLIAGDIHEISWMDVESWTVEGGSKLGTNRSQPNEDISLCAYQLQKNCIDALVIVGGFEGFTALKQLNDAKKNFISLCIPLILIPATISNNVPGTDWALGTDTALNVIMGSCDTIRQSAYSSRKRVFVVEVMGGDCGYLATMSGLASGATCAYIPEEGLNLNMLVRDCKHLIERYTDGENQGRIILRNECVSKTYTTEVVSNIFAEEGDGLFDSRSAILGHTQQGGVPSPFDRVRATRFAVKSIMWIEDLAFGSIDKHLAHIRTGQDKKLADRMASPFITDVGRTISESESKVDLVEGGVYTDSPESCGVIGIRGSAVVITPVEELVLETDFEKRKPKDSSWQELNNLIRILAKYDMEN